jgi:hypothetical protein
MCASYLNCSLIWLNLPRDDGHFLYNFLGHFGYKQKTSLRKTSLQREAQLGINTLGEIPKKTCFHRQAWEKPGNRMKEVNYESTQLGSLY